MAEADDLQQRLYAKQNRDGGWGFDSDLSWTEPTALALLALAPASDRSRVDRGIAWLLSRQNSDGGWSPGCSFPESTWVTGLALLALHRSRPDTAETRHAAGWVAANVYSTDLTLSDRIRTFLHLDPNRAPGSMPWFPGTAGWVIPTATASLALAHSGRISVDNSLSSKARLCQDYLLKRRCDDGGWNHGGLKLRSDDTVSYPETTGIALLALQGRPDADLRQAKALAQRFISSVASLEAQSWLELGLRAQGEYVDPAYLPRPVRNSRDAALRLLALRSRESSGNFLNG